jgi:cyclophilin family peptidyl-prolyl cis-trans isomerase
MWLTRCPLLFHRYGPGPHYYVEMQLVFDPESNVYDADKDQNAALVVIQTARIEHMPHSVFQFLELVSHKVYDGTTFHKRLNHIVQAGPSVETKAQQRGSLLLLDPSLSNIMFQEYSPEMAHTPYTVGFPGRPGGPDFYVNMKDNSAIHGPGGQSWHYGDLVDDADPCFGTIVEGIDVIERIHQSNVKPTKWEDAIAHPILIKKMTILGSGHDPSATSPLLRSR